MSGGSITGKLASFVRRRANSCCEYCGMPQRFDELPFEIDHVIAEQHGGRSATGNLALACFSCNRHKGPNLGGIDPKTGARVWLFHPRRQKWTRHFRWVGPRLVGRTGVGRATIATLAINASLRVRLRIELIANGELPQIASD